MGAVGRELWILLRLAVPSMLQAYFIRMADYWTLSFVGHLDGSREHYDAVVMSTIHNNITFTAIVAGTSSALGTFCAQAKGANTAHNNGVHFQRCGTVMLIICMFFAFAAFVCEPFMLLMGQPKGVAHAAGVLEWVYRRFRLRLMFFVDFLWFFIGIRWFLLAFLALFP